MYLCPIVPLLPGLAVSSATYDKWFLDDGYLDLSTTRRPKVDFKGVKKVSLFALFYFAASGHGVPDSGFTGYMVSEF